MARGEGSFRRSLKANVDTVKDTVKADHPAYRFLEDYETPWAIIPAQGGVHPFTMLVPALLAVGVVIVANTVPVVQIVLISVAAFLIGMAVTTTRNRVLVFTDSEIVVMRSRFHRPARPVELLGRVPRNRAFDVQGSFWGQILIGSEKLWVHKRFFPKLAQSDANLDSTPAKRSSKVARTNRAKKTVKNSGRRR